MQGGELGVQSRGLVRSAGFILSAVGSSRGFRHGSDTTLFHRRHSLYWRKPHRGWRHSQPCRAAGSCPHPHGSQGRSCPRRTQSCPLPSDSVAPPGERRLTCDLWRWPLEGTTRHDLPWTRLLPTSRAVGCLNGQEMNSWPPPAGPRSERICQLIRGQARSVLGGQASVPDE